MIEKPSLYDSVETNERYPKITAGGFVGIIKRYDYIPNKNYIRLGIDIAEGQFKDYFENRKNKDGSWCYDANVYLSLKDTEGAIKSFKSNITAIERSNPDYEWDWNEKSLFRKKVGIIVGLKEYATNDGTIKTKPYIKWLRSVDAIRNGDFKVPELEKLADETTSAVNSFMALGNSVKNAKNSVEFDIDEDDLPF
jgi:hypothetical protein